MNSASAPSSQALDLPLLSRPMLAVMTAQFCSALADNALLIAAIALLRLQGQSDLTALLQGVFVLPFILLAAFAGPFSDSLAKGRVMFVGNALKLAGALWMLSGAPVLLCYALVGIGATLYSPAKYGILTQFFRADRLVRANGMLEGSTIAAILLGVLVGGQLADRSLDLAFGGVVAIYALAALCNLAIPRLAAEHPLSGLRPALLWADFRQASSALWRMPDVRFSMIGTSLFWGSGMTLRLLLFAWVPVALGIHDNATPANLMGVVSVGIVLGAVCAGLWIDLARVNRALWGGVLLGPLIMALALADSLWLTALLLGLVGVCGGLFVVPLNALLQERGHATVGAGRALAVQNLAENSVMLLFAGAYTLAQQGQLAVIPTVLGFGLLMTLGLGWLTAGRRR